MFGCSQQKEAKQVLLSETHITSSDSAININTASQEELEKLPHIGAKLAQNIVKHRQQFGRFRKTEFLMLLDGVSDNRFRQIKNLVKVE